MSTTESIFSPEEVVSAQALWNRCRAFLASMLPEQTVTNWVAPIEPVGQRGSELTLRVPSEQFAMYLEEKLSREFTLLMEAFLGGNEGTLLFEYVERAAPVPEVAPTAKVGGLPAPKIEDYTSFLNKSHSFENFYESDCNRVVRSVAEGVAMRPGQPPLNLLFIYGPSGVGKTHLAQAIGLRAQEIHQDMRVCYVSASKFEAQYIQDARFRERSLFIQFYQQMDILIIDDIQFLIGKEKTQKAFFEIFNHLYLLNKQIVITSDIPPVEFRGMEERMITRLQSSMMLPLERPDLELRRRILRERLAESGVELGEEIVEMVALNAKSNVRELTGIATTLLTNSKYKRGGIDLQFARSVVSQSIKMEQREITMEGIIDLVAEVFQVEGSSLKAASRKAEIALPRQVVMYLTKTYTALSYSAIAERLKRKNHTTVMHGCKAIEERLERDEKFRQLITSLEQRLKEGE